jgi:hypothetical protein
MQWALFCGGELMDAVQRARVFNDSKTFVYVPPQGGFLSGVQEV